MSKVVGFVIGAALIVAGIATGNVGLIIQGSAMIVTQAIVDLTAPKVPARQASEMTIQLGETPRVAQFGETATAGSLVDGFNYGGKYGTDWECLVIRLADHKCEGLTGFYVNDEYNVYTGDGLVGRYDDQLEIYFRSDTTNQALPSRVTDHGPGWTSADIGESGCDVVVCYKADKAKDKHPGWPGGRPRFLFVLKGKLCYDPRKDSTVTGGSGAHRWDDASTWEWSENPIICRYNWARGIYADDDVSDQSKLLVGRGLSAEEAPPENIIAAANLCDETPPTGPLPYEQNEDGGDTSYTAGMAISAGGAWMVRWSNGSADPLEWWYLPSRTDVGLATQPLPAFGTVINVDLAADGTAYWMGQRIIGADAVAVLFSCPPRGTSSHNDSDTPSAFFAGPTRVFDLANGTRMIISGLHQDFGGLGYLDAGNKVVDAAGKLRDSALHANGEVWGLFHPDGSSNQFTLKSLSGSGSFTVTGLVTRSDADQAATFCHAAAFGHFFVISDGKFYLIDDATGAINASGTWSGETINLPRKNASATNFWRRYDQISLEDGSVIQTVDPSDWVVDGSSSAVLYDFVSNALVAHPLSDPHVTWRFLGTRTRYRVAGPVYSNQEFIDVEQMFAAAIAGNVITHEGSVELEPAQAKSVVATITDADLLTGGQVSYNHGALSDSNAEFVNSVVARYVEPSIQWQDHAAPIVRDTDDIIADGKPREASITLRLVRDLNQAQRVAEINRRLGRLQGRAKVKLGPRFCWLENGDWIAWQSDRYFGGATKTFRIDVDATDEKWQITLTLREISASVYADDWVFDADNTVSKPRLPPPDIGAPDAGDWTLTAGTLDSAGASIPTLIVVGATPTDENAEAIIVEYWKYDGVTDPTADADSVPWTMYGRVEPDTTRIEIAGLTGGAVYYVALTYVVSGIPGDRLVLGPVTVADLDVSGQAAPNVLPIDPVTGTTYTLAANDFNRHKRFTNAAGCTVTVPKNATAAYPVGGRTRMTAATVGPVILAPEDGTVTLNSRDAALTAGGEKAVFEVEKVATNEWDVLGDVTT